jgi:hypothetical protein
LVRNRRQRNADVKLIAVATIGVLLAGFVIFAGLYVASTSGDKVSCGRLPIGDADTIREDLDKGPFFQTGGASCGFWMSLDEGDMVAYKVEQPGGCTLNVSREQFVCGDTHVDVADLEQYPVSIETIDDIDTVIVDLTEHPDATTTPPG